MRDLTALALVVAVVTPAAQWLVDGTGLRQAERWLEDVRVAAFTTTPPPHEAIALVTITEATLARLPYRSPINREFLAEVVATLYAKGARAIAIDILFDQPTEAGADDRLGRVIAQSPVPVVLAYARGDGLTPRQQSFLDEFTAKGHRGLANLVADGDDGVVRYLSPGATLPGGGFIPSLATALAAAAGVPPPSDTLRLVYRGPPHHSRDPETPPPFARYPAHVVSALPRAWIDGRLVLIGADLPETGTDMHPTPFGALLGTPAGRMAGVAIHAHGVAQVLDGSRITAASPGARWLWVLAAAVVGAGLGRWHLPLWATVTALVATLGALWGYGVWVFGHGALLIPLSGPTLALLAATWASNLWSARQERRQRQFLKHAFSHYLSPQLVDQLVSRPERLALGGERRTLSILFTDVAGFTTLSESLPAPHLVRVMNAYLNGMCRIVLEHGGTIDKFIGDAVMVLFNAPLEQPDHADRAARCALALDAFAEGFRRGEAAVGDLPVAFGCTRIGVHTGEAVVGNFGSDAHFNYTAFGDTVNIAARLEGLNRHLGTRVVFSAATVAAAPALKARPAGDFVLKGKTDPVPVHTPAADAPEAEYLHAYGLLQERAPGALAAFADLRRRYPDDPLVRFHHQRLAAGETGTRVVLQAK